MSVSIHLGDCDAAAAGWTLSPVGFTDGALLRHHGRKCLSASSESPCCEAGHALVLAPCDMQDKTQIWRVDNGSRFVFGPSVTLAHADWGIAASMQSTPVWLYDLRHCDAYCAVKGNCAFEVAGGFLRLHGGSLAASPGARCVRPVASPPPVDVHGPVRAKRPWRSNGVHDPCADRYRDKWVREAAKMRLQSEITL